MLDFPIYLLYRGLTGLLSRLPLRLLFALGNAAGFCTWLVRGKYRRLATRNVAIAFGNEKSPRESRRLVRRHFQQLAANLLCGVKLATAPLDQVRARVKVENAEAAHRELRSGRPAVFILSHVGNWELQAQIFPALFDYVRNCTVFQPLGNRFINEHVRKLRSSAGLEVFDRREGFQKAIELLRSGGLIGILSDQHAGDQGLWVPFFGRLASTTSLPALLAKRTGAALLGTAIYTDGPGRWRMVFTDRIDATGESIEALTAKANELIAAQIRCAPDDWFWVHNRWKTPRPKFLLPSYKRGVYLPPSLPPKDLKPFRILIRSSNWLGDAAMSVPAVRAIKAGRPDAHITVAVPAKIAAIWKLVPEVDEVLPFENKSMFCAVRAIRRQSGFDAAILFPNSLRSALEVWLGGVPRRVGYRGQWRSRLLNQIVRGPRKPGPVKHQSNHYLQIAQQCGADVAGRLAIPSGTSNIKHPSRQNDPEADQTLKLGLCAGAEYGPAKRWLPERFAEVAATISAQRKTQWILFGTKKEAQLGDQIARGLDHICVNRVGQTTLDQLIEELRECRALVTNDTGTMHLAALLGVPVVAIFGSTDPKLTGPPGNGHIILRHQVECSPCFLRECPIDFRCMNAVTVSEVVDAVLAILSKGDSPGPAKHTKSPKL